MVIEGLLNFGISESKLFLENAKSEPRRHFWKSKFRIFVNTFSFVFHLSINIFEYFYRLFEKFHRNLFLSNKNKLKRPAAFYPGVTGCPGHIVFSESKPHSFQYVICL